MSKNRLLAKILSFLAVIIQIYSDCNAGGPGSPGGCSFNGGGSNEGKTNINDNLYKPNSDEPNNENEDDDVDKEVKELKDKISKIKYRDLFDKKGDEVKRYKESFEPGQNFTDFYDFSVDDEEVQSLFEARASIYPEQKFLLTNQGNFLHFYKVAYEKRLPVFFTADGYLEGFTKTYTKIMKIFYEEVFIHYLRRFSDNMLHFIRKNKDQPEFKSIRFSLDAIQTFYSILSSLMTKGVEEFVPEKDIELEFKKWKKTVDAYGDAEIYFLGKKKRINYSMLYPRGFWRSSQRLSNMWSGLQFLTLHKLNIDEDIKIVWIMGKLVYDAGLYNQYKSLNNFVKYFIGQDAIIPSLVDIAKIAIEEKGIKDFTINDGEIKILRDICKDKRLKLSILMLDQVVLWSKEQLEALKKERERTTYFFNQQYSVIDWMINKYLDFTDDKEKERRIVSIYEITQGLTLNNIYNKLIKNRMQGVKTNRNEIIVELRDNLNFTESLLAMNTVMNNTYTIEQDGWRDNIANHIHFAVKIMNEAKPKTYYDNIYRSKDIRVKSFSAGVTVPLNLKGQIKVNTKYISSKIVEGGIPDVLVESNEKFYSEMLVLLSRLELNLHILTEDVENAMKVNFRYVRNRMSNYIEDIRFATNLLKNASIAQDTGKMTEELKEELKKMIYAEEVSDSWDGWLTRLYDIDNQSQLFNFENQAQLINVSPRVDKHKDFPGLYHYIYNKFNHIGICLVKDSTENNEKLMIWTGSNFGEMYLPIDNGFNKDIEMIKNKVLNRS